MNFTTMNYQSLNLLLSNQILTIEINRPEKLNALNRNVLSELKDLLTQIKNTSNPQCYGIILTGSGQKAFIAGADIKEMESMTIEDAKSFVSLGQEVSSLLENINLPVISCVNGFALGGGCEMAISCDFIYATKNAIFGQPEVNLGLIPGFGGTQRLMRFIGKARSKEVIFSGRNINSDEAYRIGLVNELFETKEEMLNKANNILTLIIKKSPVAVSKCKEVINKGDSLSIEEGLQLEAQGFINIFTSEDKKEGVKAFLEKRSPKFIRG
jgi:enoyl-CoA hydratase